MPRTKEKQLSEDAKIIAGSVFGIMSPNEGTLSFEMRKSRPTGRTAAALIELVFFGIISHEIDESGTHIYRLLKNCSSYRRSFSAKKAEGFLITEKIDAAH